MKINIQKHSKSVFQNLIFFLPSNSHKVVVGYILALPNSQVPGPMPTTDITSNSVSFFLDTKKLELF